MCKTCSRRHRYGNSASSLLLPSGTGLSQVEEAAVETRGFSKLFGGGGATREEVSWVFFFAGQVSHGGGLGECHMGREKC